MKIDYQSEIDKIRNSFKELLQTTIINSKVKWKITLKTKEQRTNKKLIIQVYNDSTLLMQTEDI